MAGREKVIKGLELCNNHQNRDCTECPYNDGTLFCADVLMCDALELLKEQEAVQPKTIPEELKQKMWNALWTEEDMLEEKYVGTEEHDGWFFIYRLWLQRGFNLAIKAIADWEEGR